MKAFIDAIDKEKNDRFKNPWAKLDKGSKLNRILIFILAEKEKNNLNEAQVKKLKKLLFLICENGSINKSGDVEYSEETYHIISIKHLEYDGGSYSFTLPKKKVKTVSKSKSNIDRHFSRSKENKR